MKKLLIATDNFLPRWDGIARFLSEIVPKLSKDYHITILAPDYKGYHAVHKDLGNIVVHRFRTFNFQIGDFPPAIPPLRKVKKYVKQADIIWVQTIGPIGYSTARCTKKLNKPLIAFTHSLEWELVSNAITGFFLFRKILEKIIKRLVKRIYNRCNLLIVPSQDTANKIKKAGIKKPMKVVGLGIDIEKFKPTINKAESKRKLKIDPKKIVISYIGRLGREKDLITLYRAFVQLLYKYKNILLLVVGDGIEGYKRMFSRRKEMLYVGPRSDVEKYYQATDIYVLPSLTETTSLTTMEAMACGCTALTTKVGAIPNYLINRYNGMFFPVRNSYVLRKKLEILIDNYKLRERLGTNARRTIKTQHTWGKTVEEIEDILKVF